MLVGVLSLQIDGPKLAMSRPCSVFEQITTFETWLTCWLMSTIPISFLLNRVFRVVSMSPTVVSKTNKYVIFWAKNTQKKNCILWDIAKRFRRRNKAMSAHSPFEWFAAGGLETKRFVNCIHNKLLHYLFLMVTLPFLTTRKFGSRLASNSPIPPNRNAVQVSCKNSLVSTKQG